MKNLFIGYLIGYIWAYAWIYIIVIPVIRNEYTHQNFLTSMNNLAQDKLNDLVATNTWSHTNSDGCNYSCRLKKFVPTFTWIGENLYKGNCDINNALNMFQKSPIHKANLDHQFTYQTMQMQNIGNNQCYIVFEYGIP